MTKQAKSSPIFGSRKIISHFFSLPTRSRRKFEPMFAREQKRLIEAMLPHVAFDGWSVRALSQGARSCAMKPQNATSYFPHAQPFDFIRVASQLLDEKMLEELKKEQVQGTTAKVERALAIRMELEEEHFEAAQRAFAVLMMPHNVLEGLSIAWETCDRIWSALGSTKKDPAYQSKRMILLGVYVSTWSFWLGRKRKNRVQSKHLLKRQLSRALKLGSFASRVQKRSPGHLARYWVAGLMNSEVSRFRDARRGLSR